MGSRYGKIKSKSHVATFAVALLLLVSSSMLVLTRDSPEEPESTAPTENSIIPNEHPDELLIEPDEPEAEEEADTKDLPIFNATSLDSVISQWESQQTGKASVVALTEDGDILASINGEDEYFSASIYKLYVAYFGYQQVYDGVVDPSEMHVNGHTRAECLDLMIRESDSPCAEKLWGEIGQQTVVDRLIDLGITNTTKGGLRTTAHDAAVMMAYMSRGEGLDTESHARFLESAKSQIYRNALNKGFSDNITVYNKIGFREQSEYHDVAIVELADGRRFVLSVFTDGVGSSNIADLGRRVESVIL